MKEYEKKYSLKLDSSLPVMVRIDGHHFSSFTRGFKKPYDERIHDCMVKTVEDLVDKFTPSFGYTQSDEITLLWPECAENQTPMFSGKVVKICTLLASYTTARFNFHLHQLTFDEKEDKLKEKAHGFVAHFDARAFNVPNRAEALNNILWRSVFDCRRNAVSALGRAYFSDRELDKLGTTAIVEKLKNEKGVLWDDQINQFKFGSFTKKEMFEKEAEDFKTKEKIIAKRTRLVSKSFDLVTFTEENLDLVFRKYW
eukprot:TRINITY_DN2887_c0_g1_i1.p1 TRINITY_DN2887_c0_g1~~TRINITY_DN2887_c0_g1_i1.p1  ORF type:complete len:283 (+),score=74.16 TRINITY_DN2887_c0_g1_i1:85-849(+)